MNTVNREQFIKKLLYQSSHRGCKETDQIIGQYASANLEKMTDEQLEIFAKILALEDTDLYDWYTRKKSIPEELQSAIMTEILKFTPSCR